MAGRRHAGRTVKQSEPVQVKLAGYKVKLSQLSQHSDKRQILTERKNNETLLQRR